MKDSLDQFDVTPEREATRTNFLYRQLFEKAPPVNPDQVNLKGKVAIVTGSNTGLGLEASRQLLDLGLSKIILAVRNVTKGKIAAKELSQGRSPDSHQIEVWELDLATYTSVQKFSERAKSLERLDIVILNAGLYKGNEEFNPLTDYDEDIQTNYLSNVLLACLLLPVLKAKSVGSPGRLVLVSSDTAGWVKFDERRSRPILEAFKREKSVGKKWNMEERYGTSKLMGQLFLTKLSNEISAATVTLNLANPGFCKGSELARDGKGTLLGLVIATFQQLLGYTVNVGARSIVHAAVGFGQKSHGQYIESGRLRPKALLLYQPEGEQIADVLWDDTLNELSFANLRQVIQEVKA